MQTELTQRLVIIMSTWLRWLVKQLLALSLDIKGFVRPDIKTVATIIFSQLNDEDGHSSSIHTYKQTFANLM